MRNGMSPKKAAEDAVLRIAKYYPNYSGAIVAANVDGEYGWYLYFKWQKRFKTLKYDHVNDEHNW